MMKRIRRAQAGLGMLEVFITTFIVIMGLLVVMSSFVAIAKSNRHSERMNAAMSLARMEMERVRNLPYATIQSETGVYGEYAEHPDYRHELVVVDNSGVKSIILRIYFENDRRRAEFTTHVTNL